MTSREKYGDRINRPHLIALSSLIALLSSTPWIYGLTRFKDQLLVQTLIFLAFFLLFPFLRRNLFNQINFWKIDFWIIFTLIGILINSLVITVVPPRSMYALILFFSLVVLYIGVRNIIVDDRFLRIVMWSVFMIGTAYSLYGILQYYTGISHGYWYSPQSMASRYVNGGHFAAFLLFPIFFGLYLFIQASRNITRLLVLIPFSVLSWAFILTRSRTVWIAFSVGCILIAWYFYRQNLFSRIKLSRLTALVAGSVVFFIAYKCVGIVFARFAEIWSIKGAQFYSLIYRFQLWAACLKAILSRPLGWGAGAFSSIFPMFRIHDDRFFVDYAHNEILQTGVDFGIPGAFFLVVLTAAYFIKIARFLQNKDVPSSKKDLAVIFAAIGLSMAIASQSDFPLRIFSTTIFFFVFLALNAYVLDDVPKRDPDLPARIPTNTAMSRMATFVLCCLVFGVSIFTARQLLAEINYERGLALEKDFQWDKSAVFYEKAVSLSILSEEYYRALGDLYKKKMGLSFDPTKKNEFKGKAIESYDKAVQLNPYVAANYYYLGMLRENPDSLELAEVYFKKAISVDPMNSYFVLEYGNFALRHGRLKDALDAFEKYKNFKFREGINLCDIFKKVTSVTGNYEDLKRVVLDDWEGHRCLGFYLADQGDWANAKAEFDLCMKSASKLFDRRVFWGSVAAPIAQTYVTHGRYDDALLIYRDAAARDPENVNLRIELETISKKANGDNGGAK